jgi:glyceraldehyde 3-phosphate dehydrogenase
MPKIAINGFGRIGRQALRIMLKKYPEVEVVAINDLTDNGTLAHLLQFDSTYGEYEHEVKLAGGDRLTVEGCPGGKSIQVFSEKDPLNLPWEDLGVDVVLESTGVFVTKEGAGKHLQAGAKRVIISAPAKDEIDGTFVIGVNEQKYDPEKHRIISNASCTTNCLAPVAKIIHDAFGIEKGLMTTIHSYTNDQSILDLPHKDLRRARSAMLSLIPTTTGAAKAVGMVIPELKGKLNGLSIRVPTPTVSIVDLVCTVNRPVTKEEVNEVLKAKAQGELKHILRYEDRPLVSIDYRQSPYSAIIDALSTDVIGENMVKILAWYDNEWGYANRYVDLCVLIAQK